MYWHATRPRKTALDYKRLARAECIHFACHGRFDFEQPQQSALVLAGTAIDSMLANTDRVSEDGDIPGNCSIIAQRPYLTLWDIFALDLVAAAW